MEILGCHHILYFTEIQFIPSLFQVYGENGGSPFIRRKIIRGYLKRAKMLNIAERWLHCNNFTVAACSGGNVFNNATGSPQTALLLPCYFFAK